MTSNERRVVVDSDDLAVALDALTNAYHGGSLGYDLEQVVARLDAATHSTTTTERSPAMRGMYVICDGTDRRQSISELDDQPDGWIRIIVIRHIGADPEPLDFISYKAVAEWANRQSAVTGIPSRPARPA